MRAVPSLLLVMMAVLSIGCTHLRLHQTPPKVHVESLKLLESEGFSQRFEIGLRVINLAKKPLVIEGVHFELALNGHDLLEGVRGEELEVDAYGEATMNVVASTNLLSTLKFVKQWLQDADTSLKYTLRADFDVKGSFLNIPVNETGEVNLNKEP